MKNLYKILFVLFLTSSCFANKVYDFTSYDSSLVIKTHSQNLDLLVNFNKKEYKFIHIFYSNNKFEISNMDMIANHIENIIIVKIKEPCTVTISVTFFIGYSQVTVSHEAPCDSWKEDLRHLIIAAEKISNIT